ncbi:hypothetical protein FIV00_27895 [Labrenzia sp. THAF82]|uniref:RkpR, polysaccharide export protein n=1 Tax=Labrenzia sp. THAF82 TaxID=2587861 RepID=UPI0012688275|nr:RkpR, polysaccharide export protein [Labrenzia sp. THAF82]QFT34349.1 hypothetical protein FIV00_27895 [Labrenzia sp. THAF82]
MSSAPSALKPEQKQTSNADVVPLPKSAKPAAPLRPAKDTTLLDRLKKSGLDPQRLLDLTLPGSTGKVSPKKRHRAIIAGFFLAVLLPSIAFTAYMFFWASDQFHSVTAFAVRSAQSTPASDVLGLMFSSGSESTSSNSYIVNDYLQSQAVVEDIDDQTNLEKVFNRNDADWLFRMGTELPIEEKLSYWNSMVDVSYDATSGVIHVEVRSFDRQDSVDIARAILLRSEVLVNKLSEANRQQSVKFAEQSVAKAEARLKAIRKQMLDYRQETQEISPKENAKLTMEMIAGLEEEVIKRETERSTLLSYLDQDSPRIRIITEQISALRAQIANERQRLGSGTNANSSDRTSISFRIADYSELALEEEFAQALFTTSLAGLEQARKDADSKHLYLATFIQPTLSDSAQYPQRFIYSLAVFLLLSGLWIVSILMYYNIRDRT